MNSVAGIALSGLTAATLKLSASASNLANIEDVAPVGGAGYQPLGVRQQSLAGGGVVATAVNLRPASYLSYDPASPLANGQGLVSKPQIDPVAELANQMEAGQAYAFQLKALKIADQEQKALLDMTA